MDTLTVSGVEASFFLGPLPGTSSMLGDGLGGHVQLTGLEKASSFSCFAWILV